MRARRTAATLAAMLALGAPGTAAEPETRFDSRLALRVLAVLPSGWTEELGTTPTADGKGLVVPADWLVAPAAVPADPAEAARALAALAGEVRAKAIPGVSLEDGRGLDQWLALVEGTPTLVRLDLSNGDATAAGLARAASLPALRWLAVGRTRGRGGPPVLHGLAKASRLEHLHATEVADDAGLASISGLSALRTLDVHRSKGVTDAGVAHAARLRGLVDLDLGRTGVTDSGLSGLASLERLETLRLFDTSVGDVGLAHVARCRALRLLNVGGTRVTGAGIAHLRGHPRLETLELDRVWIPVPALLETLPTLPRLRELHLDKHTTTADAEPLRKAMPGLSVRGTGNPQPRPPGDLGE